MEEKKQGYCIITVKPGDGALIGNDIEIRFTKKGNHSKIAIKAPREIMIKKLMKKEEPPTWE